MLKYIILGPPGSGKGTQAELLRQALDLTHISVGEIFRWNIQSHTKLGARIRRLVAAGQLVPDGVVDEVVRDRLEQHDWNFGFILDGFPRSRPQAEFFLESYDIDAVILLVVPDQVVEERLLGRRVCSRCGLDYHLIFHRPAQPGICDVCEGTLMTRTDDNPVAVHERLADYHTQTEAVLEIFRARGLVVEINGDLAPEQVHDEIRRKLGLALRGTEKES